MRIKVTQEDITKAKTPALVISLFQDTESLDESASAIDSALDGNIRHLINDGEINKISDVLLDNDVEAIIISNTSDSTRDNLTNIQKHQKGGLSGKPLKAKSTILISKFYNLLKGRMKIIGVGGVDSGESAYEKFLAGANYVQLYTGMVYRGPKIVSMIKKELKELLIKDGVKNFSEIVGNKTTT